jgi:membrane fusion protein (multidrug efflux system)
VKNGKANFVNIQTGLRQANNVEITKGINSGDTVVVTGVLFVRPGNQSDYSTNCVSGSAG